MNRKSDAGFTLLEVLVTLAILGVGVALVLSLISGSLRNIRKTQLRTKSIQHAETVMELSLLDESIKDARMLQGDFEDGSRWTLVVNDFVLPTLEPPTTQQTEIPVKLLSYRVEVMGPESKTPDFRIETLKLVPTATALGPPELLAPRGSGVPPVPGGVGGPGGPPRR